MLKKLRVKCLVVLIYLKTGCDAKTKIIEEVETDLNTKLKIISNKQTLSKTKE